jgi:hypothetical protein
MTTVLARRLMGRVPTGVLAALAVLIGTRAAFALTLDDRGEMRLGLRAYTAVRVGTNTIGDAEDPLNYPVSGSGHLRQDRFFLQIHFDHDLTRLASQSRGLLAPFRLIEPTSLRYTLEFRGEGEGLYQWGPNEYSNEADGLRRTRLDVPTFKPLHLTPKLPQAYITDRVDRLLRNAQQRYRLFLAYLDFEKGPLFLRIGRQVLAWGETDVFRLLDNINPLDDSFGGFFIALDERRVPLAMARASWQLGSHGPFQDAFIEGFVAQGNSVATNPGIPLGSTWIPGGIGFPNPAIRQVISTPSATDVRGGGRLVFTAKDVTWTLAHYYTYLDVPGTQFRIPGVRTLPDGTKIGPSPSFQNPILAYQQFPRVTITGGSATFPIPSLYTIVRSEIAYFAHEPFSRQGVGNTADSIAGPNTPGTRRLLAADNTDGGVNPFVYPRFLDLTRTKPYFGQVLTLNSFNMSVGLDVNRFIRWLNPTQTFFFSTQFFYKHIFDSPGDLVLPTPYRNLPLSSSIPIIGTSCGPPNKHRPCNLSPRFYPLQENQVLQTLLITTSYSGGRWVPSFGMFYDWVGGLVFQPGVTYVRDPFRVVFDYTSVKSVAAQQFGAVRDKDNLRFQVEYVF